MRLTLKKRAAPAPGPAPARAVNITWGEFTDARCTKPLQSPASAQRCSQRHPGPCPAPTLSALRSTPPRGWRPASLLWVVCASLGAAAGDVRPLVPRPWCTSPAQAPAVVPVGTCAVVPPSDPNKMWVGSSFRYDGCTVAPDGRATATYTAFAGSRCAEPPFTNWTLSTAAMDCVKVPPGPNASAHDPPIWHSVLAIDCVG